MNRTLTDSRSLSPMEAVAVLHMSYIVLSSDSEVTTGCSCCCKSENEIMSRTALKIMSVQLSKMSHLLLGVVELQVELGDEDGLHPEQVGGRAAGLADGDQVCGVGHGEAALLLRSPVVPAGQVEGGDGDAGEVLRLRLHLGQEAVDARHRPEEDLRGQVVPHLEAAQHVRAPVPHPARDAQVGVAAALRRSGGVAGRGRGRLRAAAELHLATQQELEARQIVVEGGAEREVVGGGRGGRGSGGVGDVGVGSLFLGGGVAEVVDDGVRHLDVVAVAVTAVTAAVLCCCSLKAGSILQTVKARWGLSHWTSVFLRRRSSFD